MDIKIWYSQYLKQWRWTLLDIVTRQQESGQRYELREALDDIGNTIEHMIKSHQYEGQQD